MGKVPAAQACPRSRGVRRRPPSDSRPISASTRSANRSRANASTKQPSYLCPPGSSRNRSAAWRVYLLHPAVLQCAHTRMRASQRRPGNRRPLSQPPERPEAGADRDLGGSVIVSPRLAKARGPHDRQTTADEKPSNHAGRNQRAAPPHPFETVADRSSPTPRAPGLSAAPGARHPALRPRTETSIRNEATSQSRGRQWPPRAWSTSLCAQPNGRPIKRPVPGPFSRPPRRTTLGPCCTARTVSICPVRAVQCRAGSQPVHHRSPMGSR